MILQNVVLTIANLQIGHWWGCVDVQILSFKENLLKNHHNQRILRIYNEIFSWKSKVCSMDWKQNFLISNNLF